MTLQTTMQQLAAECGWTEGEWQRESSVIWSPDAKKVIGASSNTKPACDYVRFEPVDLSDEDFHEEIDNAKLMTAAPKLAAALYNLLREANDDGITRQGVDDALDALSSAGVDTTKFGR